MDSYPVFGDCSVSSNSNASGQESDYFELMYTQTGWLMMNCHYPDKYEKVDGKFTKFLSLKQIRDKLLETYKISKETDGVSTYGITGAQLGYVLTDTEVLRTVWELYGEKTGLGAGYGCYIFDAVTGEMLHSDF